MRPALRSVPRGPLTGVLIVAGTVLACLLAFEVEDVQLYDRMGTYALTAIGLSLLMGFAGQVSLGQGAFFLLGAYTAAIVTIGIVPSHRDPLGAPNPTAGFSPWLALAAAPVVSGAAAALVGVFLLRLRGHYLAFATLALHLMAIQVTFAEQSFLGSEYGLSVTKQLKIGAHALTGATHAAVVWGLVGAALVLGINLLRSRIGRALQAIAVSEPAAAAAGIGVASVKLRLFVLAAALAGLGGGLFALQFQYQSVSPRVFPVVLSIEFVVMVAVGGLGNIYGAVAGAVAITYLADTLRDLGQQPTLLGIHLSSHAPEVLSTGAFAIVLIVVMLLAPHGLVPAIGEAVSGAWRRRRQ
jgi:branched-chain amino acid transport system permease protein